MNDFTPEGWPTVIPRIVANDSKGLFRFIRAVFDAEGDYQENVPSILSIGDSKLMISEVGVRGSAAGFLYVYVPEVDRTYQRAIDAGAETVEAPGVTPYGDRRCMVEDRWGNTWQIATYVTSK